MDWLHHALHGISGTDVFTKILTFVVFFAIFRVGRQRRRFYASRVWVLPAICWPISAALLAQCSPLEHIVVVISAGIAAVGFLIGMAIIQTGSIAVESGTGNLFYKESVFSTAIWALFATLLLAMDWSFASPSAVIQWAFESVFWAAIVTGVSVGAWRRGVRARATAA